MDVLYATTNPAKVKTYKDELEKNHPILWAKPEEHIDNMYHEYQKVMLKEFCEKL